MSLVIDFKDVVLSVTESFQLFGKPPAEGQPQLALVMQPVMFADGLGVQYSRSCQFLLRPSAKAEGGFEVWVRADIGMPLTGLDVHNTDVSWTCLKPQPDTDPDFLALMEVWLESQVEDMRSQALLAEDVQQSSFTLHDIAVVPSTNPAHAGSGRADAPIVYLSIRPPMGKLCEVVSVVCHPGGTGITVQDVRKKAA